jgi:two-component system, chemotaxis family, CheB/CheR fusion protein
MEEMTQEARASALEPCPVVGIGASAGGLEAFTRLLSRLPVQTGMAYVIVQHLGSAHQSLLSDLLARATKIRITPRVIEPASTILTPFLLT